MSNQLSVIIVPALSKYWNLKCPLLPVTMFKFVSIVITVSIPLTAGWSVRDMFAFQVNWLSVSGFV